MNRRLNTTRHIAPSELCLQSSNIMAAEYHGNNQALAMDLITIDGSRDHVEADDMPS